MSVEAAWIRIQRKTFTRWCNQFLTKRGLEAQSLEKDLADGVLLHALLEELTETKITPVPKTSNLKIKKVENVSRLLSYIQTQGVKLVGIGAEDIHDGNTKLILGFIWTLIMKYQIITDDDEDGEARGFKNALLAWCNAVLNPQGIVVANFNRSWTDGRAFCGLVNALEPGSFNLEQRTPDMALENLGAAFDTAFDKFQIPKMLDPEDTVSDPDELSLMTYISYYRGYLQKNTAYGPNCYAEGPGLTTAETKRRAEFTVIGVNAEGEKANRGGAPVRAQLLDADNSLVCKVFVKDNLNGTYSCHYEPPKTGSFLLEVKVGKEQIQGSCFKPFVEAGEPKPDKCWAEGPGLSQAVAGEDAHFTVFSADAGGNPLSKGGANIVALLKDEKGKTTPVRVSDNGDGTYACVYTPKSASPSTLSVQVKTDSNGTGEVKGGPFKVAVSPGKVDARHTIAKGEGTKAAKAGQHTPLTVVSKDEFDNPLTTGGANLKGKLRHLPTGEELPVSVVDNGDGTYALDYTPTKAGTYQMDITLDDQHIKDSPLTITVAPGAPDLLNFDWDELGLDSDGRKIVVAGVTDSFNIASKDAFGNPCSGGGLEIEGTLTGTENVPVMVSDNGDGTYAISYTPKKTGPYDLDIRVNGKRIGGRNVDEPVKLLCIPGKPSGHHSVAHGPGVQGNATLGDDNSFTIQAKDAFGNNVIMGGAKIGGELVGEDGSRVPVVARDNGDGTYDCTYPALTKIGNYTLTPTLDGASIKDAPFPVRAWAGETSTENTLVSVPPFTEACTESIEIELRDAHGNKRERTDKDVVRAICTPLTHPILDAYQKPDGTYGVDFPPNLVGNYEVHITVNDQEVPTGPWTNQILPNPIDQTLKDELASTVPKTASIWERMLQNARPEDREVILADLRAIHNGNVKANVVVTKKENPKKRKHQETVEVSLSLNAPTPAPLEHVEETVSLTLPGPPVKQADEDKRSKPKRAGARPATSNPIKAAAALEAEDEAKREPAKKRPPPGAGAAMAGLAAISGEAMKKAAEKKSQKGTEGAGETTAEQGKRVEEEKEIVHTYKAPSKALPGAMPMMGFGKIDAGALRKGLKKTDGTSGDTHK